ncbi:MAG TPA: ABC transporter substrate-binding protein [Pyrinomonadaceae bacterium]|nr:ABC transporter substrate-binding protein [Pyrinomonadaceae bacterium]
MSQRSQFFAILFWAALAFGVSCVLLPNAASVAQVQEQRATSAERGLSPAERRGKAIYLRGASPSGKEITAMVGDMDLPASTLTCAGCHGLRGEGKTEGGVTAGNLTWADLAKPYGHTHSTGRKHGPFNEKLFTRSLVQGLDPAGNEMAVAMPRYEMSDEDMANLIAYLKRIESDRDPGLTATSVRLGTILPKEGGLSEIGAAMKDVLTAYFANVNDRGGIYNRSIELQTIQTGSDAAATAANVRKLVENGELFAMVSGLSAGADKELAALTQETEIPFMGPVTLLPQTGFQSNRNVFYLLPGASEQARALVNFAANKPELQKRRLAIVHSQNELALAAAEAIEDQARKKSWTTTRKSYSGKLVDAAGIAATLKGEGTEAVFFLGAGGEEALFINAAAAANWTPYVFLLGALAGRELVQSVPLSFKDHVFLSFPTVPGDVTPEGMAELRALQEKYKFATRHVASQLMAFAAAKIFTEALKRAGRDLSREKLVTELEGLYEYETGVTPRITFGPNRRVGAMGAYVVSIDPAKKEFVSASGWVKNN